MSGKFGGGGSKCTRCNKTSYPAETIQFEKAPYHAECFTCKTCEKRMDGPSKAQGYEGEIYCKQCFAKNGFAQKQRQVKWTKGTGSGSSSAIASKFGGGGNPCEICGKTVYPAETVSHEKKIYHPDCFKCSLCDAKRTASQMCVFEGDLICSKCFAQEGYAQKQAKTTTKTSSTNALASKFGGGGTKCVVCTKTVYQAELISFDKSAYHAPCFKCTICDAKKTPSAMNKFEDDLICSKCFGEGGYRQKQVNTKSTTKTSSTTNALASRFGGGGTKCFICTKTVYAAELISFQKQAYHADCFCCKNCDKKLTVSSAEGKKQEDGTYHSFCRKCWGELGYNRADK